MHGPQLLRRCTVHPKPMSEWIKSLIQEWSYAGVIFLMFLENVFPPIPSELIMPLAGFYSTTGEFTLLGIIGAGTLGSVGGAMPLYYVGKLAGQERVRRWCERHGKWLGLSGRDVDKSKKWFDRHGAKTVLLCRMVPGVRSLISIPAGVANMPLWRFIFLTSIGSAVWTAALALSGRALAQNYEKVEKFVGPISTTVIVGIVLMIAFRALRQRQLRNQTRS